MAATTTAIAPGDALLVVDVQNCFCPGGALAVPEGDAVVPVINALAPRFANVVLTQDWHPAGHISFASQHAGRQPFETIALPYGEQVLWPDHAVQATPGAELHPALAVPNARLILRKGMNPLVDSYSAFLEADRKSDTGLAAWLRSQGVTRVFCVGLALDYCVAWTALDARAAGFDVTVIENACRAIDANGSLAAARASMTAAGIALLPSLD
ncbi:bifunctional nicotinamidase/pyrazinamidase [Derxia lacustris]|uniref:bifunctional nicotinamidase/pyrazinamidase n=1 Tax=Derxia lacustris TaxID=764842 RepID=UPI000A1769B6|nr:bifunctional nicotinamidase/pyrazinamidase [Derxia lacustris]